MDLYEGRLQDYSFPMPFGLQEILILVAIVIVVFGAKRLPDIARALGKSVKSFRKGLEGKEEKKPEKDVTPPKDEA